MQEDWTKADRALDDFKAAMPSLIEQNFREARCTTEYQSTIYHYTDTKGALGILQTGKLWFTERAHLNDPVEIRYGLDLAHELFKISANNRGARIPKEAALHLKGEHHFGLSYYGFWTISFSRDCDDLGQWRSYADDGRGVCLGFSSEKIDMTQLGGALAE